MPIPKLWTGRGGGRPAIPKIGGIWVRFAPGRLNRPKQIVRLCDLSKNVTYRSV